MQIAQAAVGKKDTPQGIGADTTAPTNEGAEISRWMCAALLFFSGAAGLIYQVLWAKQLSLVVGVEVYSITVAVSAFFVGLGVGNIVFGRWADRSSRPARLYAILEALVAVTGVLVTVTLPRTAGLFAALTEHMGWPAWILLFALIGVPAFLMGGTLPALARALIRENEAVSEAGGVLYAANTLGGVAGALLSSFVLIPLLGIRGSSLVAAALNLAACAGAIVFLRFATNSRSAGTAVSQQGRAALVLYCISGGIALGYEVVWSQSIVMFLSTRVFAFSIVLATYLAGIFLGSLIASRYATRVRDPWGMFALLISAAGVIALVEAAVLGSWQFHLQAVIGNAIGGATDSLFLAMCVRFAVAALGTVFLPTLLLGAAFPFVLRLVKEQGGVGHEVGAVLGWNTVGGVVGTLLTGFVLVPRLGLILTLVILAAVALLVACLALRRSVEPRMAWGTGLLGVIFIVTALLVPSSKFGNMLAKERGGTLHFYEESSGGSVAVIGQNTGSNRFRRLYIQGVSNSGDAMTSVRYMRLQALLPLIVHQGEPHSALVIGLGTGITAGALTQYPGLTEIRCAELLNAVVRASSKFSGNYGGASNPLVQIRLRDGRRELVQSGDRYDLITLEPPPPSAASVANLYSVEFYRLAAARLNRDGIVAQWLPITTQNDGDTKSLVRSFTDVFPYASMWTTELHEMLLIGSLQPMPLDATRIAARYNQKEVADSLADVGIASPEALMSLWVTDREGLVRYSKEAPAVTDDRPRIEYSTWVTPREILLALPELMKLRGEAPLEGADDALRNKVKSERDGLDDFYAAGLAAYAGDRHEWAERMKRVMKQDRGNPYYRWILGE